MKKEVWIKLVKRIGNWIVNICFYSCVAFVAWMVLQVFCLTSFKIPPIQWNRHCFRETKYWWINGPVGHVCLISLRHCEEKKWISIVYRVSDRFSGTMCLFLISLIRMGSDSIGFDIMKYYVKRCIALPGDTLEIRKGYYHIKGITDSVGNVQAQHRIARVRREDSHGIVMDAFPWDGRLGWTIQEFGPLPVPAKGQVVKIDTLSCLLYGRLIHWEQKKRLRQKGEAVCLGDSAITEYKFTENYYFVSGDNMENSKDSRYWGMLPESYIVGRAFTIWRSDDPLRGKIRWNRVFKRIK